MNKTVIVSIVILLVLGLLGGLIVSGFSKFSGTSQNESDQAFDEWAQMFNEVEEVLEAGNLDKSRQLADQALAFVEKHIGTESYEYGMALAQLARVYVEQGEYAKAEVLLTRAEDIFIDEFGNDHQETHLNRVELAAAIASQDRLEEAVKLYEQSLEYFEKEDLAGSFAPWIMMKLKRCYAMLGREKEIESLYQHWLDLAGEKLQEDDLAIADVLTRLADEYSEQGRSSEAEPLYRRALEIREAQLDSNDPLIGDSLASLGQEMARLGDLSGAIPLFRRSLSILENQPEPDSDKVLLVQINLGWACLFQHQAEEATRVFEQALQTAQNATGDTNYQITRIIMGLASIDIDNERFDNAMQRARQAKALLEKIDSPAPVVKEALQCITNLVDNEKDAPDMAEIMKLRNAPWDIRFPGLDIPMDAVERIRLLADKMVEEGFPDARDAEFLIGEIRVTSTVDPKKQDPVFPAKYSKMQVPDPQTNTTKYVFVFEGFHARLPDGTWILEMGHPFREDSCSTIDYSKATPFEPAWEFAGIELLPYDFTGEEASSWLEGYPDDVRERQIKRLEVAVPITKYLWLPSRQMPFALVLLHRAGMTEAPLLAMLMADWRSRNYEPLHYWDAEPGPYDPRGMYEEYDEFRQAWREQNTDGFPLEPMDVAFRRDLHRMLRWTITAAPEDAILEPAVAARLARLCLEPGDPQGIGNSIDRLLEATEIPKNPGPNATLVDRLRSWSIPEEPEMVVKNTESEDGSVGMTTEFITPEPAYVPDEKDLDALFGLLDNTAPSRFIDYQGSRDIGENAMRAIAEIIGRNPLELVEMDSVSPWTPQRRKEAVKKLQQWWAEHNDDYENFVVKDAPEKIETPN